MTMPNDVYRDFLARINGNVTCGCEASVLAHVQAKCVAVGKVVGESTALEPAVANVLTAAVCHGAVTETPRIELIFVDIVVKEASVRLVAVARHERRV